MFLGLTHTDLPLLEFSDFDRTLVNETKITIESAAPTSLGLSRSTASQTSGSVKRAFSKIGALTHGSGKSYPRSRDMHLKRRK